MKIGLLALQGAVSEHKISMRNLGTDVIEVREPKNLNGINGLIMPGGESTTLRKLLKNSGLWKAIEEMDLPIMGTCAGAILLGKCDDETFAKMDIEINRNYYGRQKDSFEASITLGNKDVFNGVFIRAPAIISVGEKATAIAWKGKEIVGCIDGKNMALTFHPELTNDLTFHKMWKEGLK
jgi:5'-phosphate synthase pdxT subunit